MILSLLLLQAALDPTTVAARLDTGFRGRVQGAGCKVSRSTGNAAIDRIGCRAVEVCVPAFASRYQSAGDRQVRPGVKKVMRAALDAELADCIATERRTGITALLAAREGV